MNNSTPPTSLRLRKRHRLAHDNDYAAVFRAKVRKHRGPVTVFARPNGLEHHRLGLSIGRRFGLGVRRNALKRQLREAFRINQHRLPGAYDFIITARAHDIQNLDWYADTLTTLAVKIHRVWTERQSHHAPPSRTEPR